jgi:hypothetical protein
MANALSFISKKLTANHKAPPPIPYLKTNKQGKRRQVLPKLKEEIDQTELDIVQSLSADDKEHYNPSLFTNNGEMCRKYDTQVEMLMARGVSNPFKIHSMLKGVVSIQRIKSTMSRIRALWAMNLKVNDMEEARTELIAKIHEIYFQLWTVAEMKDTKRMDKIHAFSVLADLIKKEAELRGFDKNTINMLVNVNRVNYFESGEAENVLQKIVANKATGEQVMQLFSSVNSRLQTISHMKEIDAEAVKVETPAVPPVIDQ